MSRGLVVVLGCAVLASAGCPGRGGPDDRTPPFLHDDAGDLGEPPGPSPDTFGLAWMEQLYPRFRDDWAAFINDCRLRLAADHPLNDRRLAVVIGVTIDRHGSVRRAAVDRASGNADFDAVALDIVRDAAPYPAPPAELVSDDDRVHLRWAFHRDRRLAGPATAAVERIEWPLERAVPRMLAAGDLAGAARRIEVAARAGGRDDRLLQLTRSLAVAIIRRALVSTDADARRAGIAAARRTRLAAAADVLRALAGGASDPALQRDAIRALGAIGDAAAAPALLAVVGERSGVDSAATSAAAVEALAALGKGSEARQSVADRLAATDKEAHAHALAVAAQVAIPEALGSLAALAASPATPRHERVTACAAVALAGAAGDRDAALRALRRGLDASDAAVRAACAHGVATVAAAGGRSKGVYWRAAQLLTDRDERVRAGAVLAVAHLDPVRAGKELPGVAREKSSVVLAAHAEALAVLPGQAALDRLAALARSSDHEVRRAAAGSLARRPEKGARELLAGMSRDADPGVQLVALSALEAAEAFEPLIDAADPEVRAAAFARLVAARGQAAAIGALCARLDAEETEEADAARLAGAWLTP